MATTVTGPGGAFLFTGVPADGARDWVVTMNTGQAPLSGYTARTSALFSYANLPSGAVRVDADFGFNNPTGTFTITDGVWLDNGLPTGTANNGVKDGTEAGIGAGTPVPPSAGPGKTVGVGGPAPQPRPVSIERPVALTTPTVTEFLKSPSGEPMATPIMMADASAPSDPRRRSPLSRLLATITSGTSAAGTAPGWTAVASKARQSSSPAPRCAWAPRRSRSWPRDPTR